MESVENVHTNRYMQQKVLKPCFAFFASPFSETVKESACMRGMCVLVRMCVCACMCVSLCVCVCVCVFKCV